MTLSCHEIASRLSCAYQTPLRQDFRTSRVIAQLATVVIMSLPHSHIGATPAGTSPATGMPSISASKGPQSTEGVNPVAAYDVWIGEQHVGTWDLLTKNSLLYATESTLQQWGLSPRTETPTVEFVGKRWHPLIAFADSQTLTLNDRRIRLTLRGKASVGSAKSGSTPPDTRSTAKARLLPLEVILNGANVGNWILLESEGFLYVNEATFTEWRINHRPIKPPLNYRNQRWYGLDEIAGYKADIDYAAMTLRLQFSSQSFIATEIEEEPSTTQEIAPSQWALFGNYDLSYTHSSYGRSYNSAELGALTELGLTSPWGVMTSSYVGRNLDGSAPDQRPNWTRLETRMVHNDPESKTTWSLGDTTTRSGMMVRPVYFGGLQIRRNFALSPGFVTHPTPALAGTSNSPSTVEVYINDALRQTSKIPPGPFTIQNVAPVTGSGDIRVVVRDILGRETVTTQSFFSDSSLLAPGLSDWGIELGMTRHNLGLADADYGEVFTSGLWRGGISTTFTLEAQGGWSQSLRTLGAGANFTLPLQSVGQAAVAVSDRRDTGAGTQWLLGLQRQSHRHGISLRMDGSTAAYRWLGNPDTPSNPRQMAGTYHYTHPEWGNLGISVAQVQPASGGDALQTVGASYSIRLGNRGSLSLSATRYSSAVIDGYFAGVTLVLPTDGGINRLASVSSQSGRTDGYASAQKGFSTETGHSWRVLAGEKGGHLYSEGGLSYQGAQGLLTSEVSSSETQQSVRIGMQGGLIWMGSHVMATRTLQDSFALVEVPGYPNVSVGLSGSRLTRTNADGLALLPRLNAYASNAIRLDPSDLPINAELDSIEQVVVPAWRSAVKVVFPVRSGRGALLTIHLDDGGPAPAGSELKLKGDKQIFYVARRGLAFVTGLGEQNTVDLHWRNDKCTLTFALPPGRIDDIARVGPLTCRGIKR